MGGRDSVSIGSNTVVFMKAAETKWCYWSEMHPISILENILFVNISPIHEIWSFHWGENLDCDLGYYTACDTIWCHNPEDHNILWLFQKMVFHW
jgi:hypothetical protein